MYNNHSQRRTSRPQRNGFSQRGRSGGGSSSNSGARSFESNGPANFRVRGKPIQIHDKYVQLARDSAASGDKILTEDLLQHAEHYLRMQNNSFDRTASSEKNNETPQQAPEEGSASTNERGQSSYSYAPRGHSRRRWAVATADEKAREGNGDGNSDGNSEETSDGNSDGNAEEQEQQAEVEQRSPLSSSSANRNSFAEQGGTPRDDDRDYSTETSYE